MRQIVDIELPVAPRRLGGGRGSLCQMPRGPGLGGWYLLLLLLFTATGALVGIAS